MIFADIKLLYAAFGYMKTTTVAGRELIDELRDMSRNKSHITHTGGDRAEYKDLQIAVEKAGTNMFLNSETLSTQDVTVTADPYTVSMEGTGTITFSGVHTGSIEGVEGDRVSTTFTPSAGTLTCTVSGTVSKAQIEQSSYPTLYIPTEGTAVTRPSPAPVIENALPETGTVAGVVDMVRDDNEFQPILRGQGVDTTTRTLFQIQTGDRLHVRLFGSGGSDINPTGFDWSNFGRATFAYIITYNSAGGVVVFLLQGGNIGKHSFSVTYDQVSFFDMGLGHHDEGLQSSCRFETPLYKDNIVRVNATDEEIKRFFEVLTTGTSIQTKTSEMTIIA